jgi:hypothetical protein
MQQRRLALLRQKAAAIKADGLAYYRPSEKQDAYHVACSTGAKHTMVDAGNRFGKSTMGCAEDLAWARGERPWYKHAFDVMGTRMAGGQRETYVARRHEGHAEHPLVTAGIPKHPVKILIITTDWDKVDEIWTSERGDNPGKVWKFIPRSAVVSKKRNHSGAIDTLEIKSARYDGNSLIRFDTVKSFMANPQGSESSDWDRIHVDEPCPEAMYKASARGLMDRNGVDSFTLTPLKEFWINDFFFPQDTGGLPRLGVWALRASTYDNPFLSLEAIRDYEATLSDEERQCRIYGIPMHLAGLVYKSFSWDRHVLKTLPHGWDDWTHPPKNYTIYVKIDPHPQTPHAVLFCAVAPTGERFYYYDMFKKCGIAELAKDILAFTAGYHLQSVECDPLGFIEHPITGTSMATEFGNYGLYVDKATKALAHGIVRVNEELSKRDPQAIWFSPYAKRTLWEIQRYAWDDKNDRPVDADDHMMENLYRNELSEPVWVDRGRPSIEIRDEVILSPNFRVDESPSLSLAL